MLALRHTHTHTHTLCERNQRTDDQCGRAQAGSHKALASKHLIGPTKQDLWGPQQHASRPAHGSTMCCLLTACNSKPPNYERGADGYQDPRQRVLGPACPQRVRCDAALPRPRGAYTWSAWSYDSAHQRNSKTSEPSTSPDSNNRRPVGIAEAVLQNDDLDPAPPAPLQQQRLAAVPGGHAPAPGVPATRTPTVEGKDWQGRVGVARLEVTVPGKPTCSPNRPLTHRQGTN